MCGIAGWVDWRRDLRQEAATLERMAAAMAPRGPDDAGLWLSTNVAFAHRRLIVVDPAGGAQPMHKQYGTRRFVITYNGELYNTEDLRRDLLARGYRFDGHSDTEVLLAAYAHWGEACLSHLNGIFAFAIWNEAEETLFLARDRLGVKPLFYAERPDAFLYASELKGLLANPLVPAELDRDGLSEAFLMAPSRTPGHGVFRGVKELRPGWSIRVTRRGSRLHRYWALEAHEHLDSAEETAARVRFLLRDAVERQLISDVPISTLLSGGLDSSAVTAFAAEGLKAQGRDALRTYSVEFAEMDRHFRPTAFQKSLDGPWVQRVSELFATDHRRVVLDTPELVHYLGAALQARDLPGMADVDTSLLLFCRDVRRGATVALSGESADEVFGGYPWFYREDALAAHTFPWALRQRDRVALLNPEFAAWLEPEQYVANRYEQALAEVPSLPGEDPTEARMRELLYLNITRFLPTLLDRKDRMSMATGLEVRVPFCDHRLVEYTYNIPWALKTYGGHPKGILREALRGILPDDVLYRPKSPYPSTPNPTYLSAMRSQALEVLSDPGSPLSAYLNRTAIERLAREEQDPFALPWFSQLMGLAQWFSYVVQLDLWLRSYRIRPIADRGAPDLPHVVLQS
ncbi:MAG: asparagine synthase (glutamine-hydrolyzing) [Thermaerobacter sp.]|nr:asparagine synthase (glutamine-hydrolyzing) [Thermaerobacter sp.]